MSRRGGGTLVLGIGLALGSPALIIIGIIQMIASSAQTVGVAAAHTASVATAHTLSAAAAAGTVTAASTTGAAIAFSALTLGIGAAVIYAAYGIAYAISAGMESYKSNKGIGEIVGARIWNKDKFTGFNLHSVWEGIKSAAAILWSPWLFAGAAAGKGVKMAVDAIRNNAVTVPNRHESAATPNHDVSGDSYKAIENGLSNTGSLAQVGAPVPTGDYNSGKKEVGLKEETPASMASLASTFFRDVQGVKEEIEDPSNPLTI